MSIWVSDIDGNNSKVLTKPGRNLIPSWFPDSKHIVWMNFKDGKDPAENSQLQIPFEAVAINAVEVTAFQIYADNVGQFLQVNSIDENSETGRVGRYLWRKTLPLNAANYDQWNRYSIDVTDLMKDYNGSLIRLELSAKRRHSTYACVGSEEESRSGSQS